MMYGSLFNIFLKENISKTDKEKIEILKEYNTGDILILLRNIEEKGVRSYTPGIIKAVTSILFDRNIILM